MVNHRIRVVNGTTITTLAGDGTPGFTGDGGAAASARLYSPRGLSINAVGDLYIADTSNNRIRRIDHATLVIATVAGNGTAGYADNAGATAAMLNLPRDVFVDAAGNLYIADTNNNVVRKVRRRARGSVEHGRSARGPRIGRRVARARAETLSRVDPPDRPSPRHQCRGAIQADSPRSPGTAAAGPAPDTTVNPW